VEGVLILTVLVEAGIDSETWDCNYGAHDETPKSESYFLR